MKAQTYVDVVRGLESVRNRLGQVTFVDRYKHEITSDEGALALLRQIEETTETCRQIIMHDSGIPTDMRLLGD